MSFPLVLPRSERTLGDACFARSQEATSFAPAIGLPPAPFTDPPRYELPLSMAAGPEMINWGRSLCSSLPSISDEVCRSRKSTAPVASIMYVGNPSPSLSTGCHRRQPLLESL